MNNYFFSTFYFKRIVRWQTSVVKAMLVILVVCMPIAFSGEGYPSSISTAHSAAMMHTRIAFYEDPGSGGPW